MLTEKCAPTKKTLLAERVGRSACIFFFGGGSKTLMSKCDPMVSIVHMYTRIDL